VTEQTEQAEQSPVRPDWRGIWLLPVVALLLGALLWHDESKLAAAKAEAAAFQQFAAAARQAVYPAPKVRKATAMAAYIVSGGGVSAANGTYTPTTGGYENGSGWYLYYSSGESCWCLGTVLGEAAVNGHVAYTATGTSGTVATSGWSVHGAYSPDPSPAPTVAAGGGTAITTDTDPYNFPYSNWWWGGSALTASPIAPALVTIGGTQYVVFCAIEDDLFALFDPAGEQWYSLAWDNAPFASWDTAQSGCLIDAGDDANIWCLSGGVAGPGFTCSKHSGLTGARASQQAVTTESAVLTNMVSMDGGTTARFAERSTTTLRYHSYVLGAASYTELFEATAGNWPGLLPSTSDAGDESALHNLCRTSGGDVYYIRKYLGLSGTPHGYLPYRLSTSGAELLNPLRNPTGTYAQVGEYRGGLYLGVGTKYMPSVYSWVPGVSWEPRYDPWVRHPMGRHWYLSDTTNGVLYLAGWGTGAAAGLPFVMAVQPASGGTPSLIASTAQVFAPTIAKHVSGLSLIASTATVYAPTIAGVDLVDAGSRIGSTGTVYAPTLYGTADRTAAAGAGVWRRVRAKVGPEPV
jgi:hypothetical protein